MNNSFRSRLLRRWYGPEGAAWQLRPLAVLFGFIASIRRRRQQAGARQVKFRAPVVVVGNIAVGGTGKTPYVLWLVERLKEWGWKPGVVSRGYGGRALQWPQRVAADSDPGLVGDEAVLIAQRGRVPVAVGPDRVAAVRALLDGPGSVDIVVSDDGLQHYRMPRDAEFAVVDATRGIGNGRLLPAGPLREPVARLKEVGLVVINGSGWDAPAGRQIRMRLRSTQAHPVEGGAPRPITDFAGQTVHAVAGIGNPARFFSMLSKHGIRLVMHPFPDHHPFRRKDLEFGDTLPVLMTEKDAVKCRDLAAGRHWVVPVQAEFSAEDTRLVQELISALRTEFARGDMTRG